MKFNRKYLKNRAVRSGPRNSDSQIIVSSARRGDGIAHMDGDGDGKKAKTQSRGEVQGTGGTGGDSENKQPGDGPDIKVDRALTLSNSQSRPFRTV